MSARQLQHPRGTTLLEVLAAAVVLQAGVLALVVLVLGSVRQNRVSLNLDQAQQLASQRLEEILAMGCTPGPASAPTDVCRNIKLLDHETRQYWQTYDGTLTTTNPGVPARWYQMATDVDAVGSSSCGPTGTANCLEGAETGVPTLVAGIINVRVTVSWTDPDRPSSPKVVALQTRMSP